MWNYELGGSLETHSVIARCMGKTCGSAAVLAATAATAAPDLVEKPIFGIDCETKQK